MPGIVLTTDLSSESKRAFAPVRELAQKLGMKVHLLAVLEDMPFEPTGGGLMAVYPDRRQIKVDWEKSMAALADEFGRELCAQAVVIDAVDVSRAIVDFAQQEKADFVAMATHGRSGLRRLLLGSVAEVVIRHSHVPVIVYPPPA
ncbi:MAG: universal stress protein [Planctomycetes bacterium]|jgi:nucleotide-binding universal stress UspA family protein|nr:universal stress protein [Planctomycetota bacterium]MCC7066080.1 universal stress protein [Planctomycetota bacterium]